jgi:predicted TIM-barrel enzyme
MRVVPSLTTTGTAADYAVFSRNTVTACNTVPVLGGNSVSPKTLSVYSTVASGLTIGNAMQLTSNNNKTSYLLLTAEL